MTEKQQRIGKDGQVKTVVKKALSREERIQQHMHGRSDHIRSTGNGRFILATILIGVVVIGLIWLIWRLVD